MKYISTKSFLAFGIGLFTILGLSSCKKQISEKAEEPIRVQYLKAEIGSQSIDIRKTDNDRNLFYGSWTGVGMATGTQIDMYSVELNLSKVLLVSNEVSKLRFQIFDIKTKQYQIDHDFSFPIDFTTYIYMIKNAGGKNEVIYSTSRLKKPFSIEVKRFEYPNDSIIPIVGGKFNGVLYNTKNLKDSVVIENGEFEVR